MLILVITFGDVSGQIEGASLNRYFNNYELVTFNTQKLQAYADRFDGEYFDYNFQLSEKYNWNISVHETKIFSDNYILRIGNDPKLQKDEIENLPKVLQGFDSFNSNTKITITVNDGFLYGMVRSADQEIYFEPLSTFDANAKENDFIIYNSRDIVKGSPKTCAAEEFNKKSNSLQLRSEKSKESSNYRAGGCIEVELAIANDYRVYQSRTSGVANFNAGVIGNVNSDYDNSFSDEIRFVIVETYISTSEAQDEWGGTSDAGQLLDGFTAWAPSASGFSNTHDLGELWSGYDFDGTTIGLAWLNTVCGRYGYHVLEDFSNTAALLRNLVSHEIGHNFSLPHVTSSNTKIMSGTVSGTSTWNSSSIDNMNSTYPDYSCLNSCDGPPPPPPGDAPVADFSAVYISECNPTRIQFLDQSTNTPTEWSWEFQSGNPSTSSLQNPEIDFPGGGDYRVTLTASNANGSNTEIKIMTLDIIPAPIANFNFSISGNAVNFNNTSTNSTSYSWNFGDGGTSSSTNPSHNYTEAGTYTVTLTSSNDCGTDTESQSVTIADNVSAAFTFSNSEICEGDNVQYTNQSSGNITSYFWEFEGGSPSSSTAENPTVQYSNQGIFNARLTVSNSTSSDLESKTNIIDVSDIPSATFSHTINGYNVSFDNNTIGGTQYDWSFGDGGTSVNVNPNYSYDGPGTYEVILEASNNCGGDATTQVITIDEIVLASFTADVQETCFGESITFTNTTTGGATSYFWEFEGGSPSTSTIENPTVNYPNSGTFNVRLTAENNSTSDVKSKFNYISINDQPSVDFFFSVDRYVVDFDNNTELSSTYLWDFGDGSTTTVKHPTHTYETPGNFIVSLTSSNDCGTTSIQYQVEIEEFLEPSFESTTNSVCTGESIAYFNNSLGDISSYFWEFEGGTPSTSNEENPTILYNTEGNFDTRLTITGIYGGTEFTKINQYVQATQQAVADFSYNLDEFTVSFTNNSSNYDQLNWDFGDGTSTTISNPSHTYENEGDYSVVLTIENDCGVEQKVISIPVFDQLLANFQASKTMSCPGETITLQDLSTGNPTEWEWSISGPEELTVNTQNPELIFTLPGIYNISLTVRNADEVHTISKNEYLEVLDLAIADFSYVQEELEVVFENQSQNGLEYFWDFGDGKSSNDFSPTHSYVEEGTYIVKFEVGNQCGVDVHEYEIDVFKRLIVGFNANSNLICSGYQVQFNDLSSASASSWSWTFPGGNPAISSEKNPIVTYPLPGNYDVELMVTNDSEEVSTVESSYIEVLEAPSVEITSLINEYNTIFEATDVGANEFYWDFGDGKSSNLEVPEHIYDQEGIYDVMLIITNICGFDTVFTEVKVEAEIVASFETAQSQICPEDQISFIETSSKNVISFEWNFPGGTPSTSTERNPKVQYQTTGIYDVELKISSLFSEKILISENEVRVLEDPEANFNFDINRDSVRFYNTSLDGLDYEWLIDGNIIKDEINPLFVFDEEGTYEVRLITSNNCANDTIYKAVNLADESSYANFSLLQSNYCINDTVQFVDLSSNDITEWHWEFEGGSPAISSQRSPKISYSDFGNFDVTLVVSNGFNKRELLLPDYIKIVEKPVANFDLEQIGNKVELTNLSTQHSETNWSFGDGSNSSNENASNIYSSNGTYEIDLNISNSCGESDYSEEVEISVYPKASFSLDVVKGCSPLLVNFENRSSSNAEEIEWVLKGGAILTDIENNPAVQYDMPGYYDIVVIAYNEWGSDTLKVDELVEVEESPELEFEYLFSGRKLIFLGAVSKYDSLVWDFGDGTTANTIEAPHKYADDGVYNVTLTAYLGDCSSVVEHEVAVVQTSTTDLSSENKAVLFPNPAQNLVNVRFENAISLHSASIIDLMGRTIWTKSLGNKSDFITLDFTDQIPSGSYILHIKVIDDKSVFLPIILID